GVMPRADTQSARQRKRVRTPEVPESAAAGNRGHRQQDQERRAGAAPGNAPAQCPPPTSPMFSTLPGNIIERRPVAGSTGSGFAGLAGTNGAFVLIMPLPKKLKMSFAGGSGPLG